MQKPRKSKRKLSHVILKNYTLFAFLSCIAWRYTAFYTALRGAIPLFILHYAALYRILHWCGAIPYTALVRRYTAMVSLVSSSSVTLFRVDTTSPVLLSISAAQ